MGVEVTFLTSGSGQGALGGGRLVRKSGGNGWNPVPKAAAEEVIN